MAYLLVLVCALAVLGRSEAESDPCKNHGVLNSDRRSTAYTMGSGDVGLCDIGLAKGWYRFTSSVGGRMPERCIRRRQCGTLMPVWLNGTHPSEQDGVVFGEACTNAHGGGTGQPCCEHSTTIGILNCGSFFVYYLFPTPLCSSAYCAGDKLGCPPGKSSSTGYGPCEDSYPPEFDAALPSLSEPEVHGHGFRFRCDVNLTGHHNESDLMYEVQWTFGGNQDPNVPNMILKEPHRTAYLPGSALKDHLGTDLGCKVRSWYSNRTTVQRSPWRASNTYWAGIKATPKVEVTEKGENHTVTVTSTIPIVCDFQQNSSCCLHLALDTQGPNNNAVLPHPCHYTLCKADWNPQTHTASTNITITGAKDQIRDGTKTVFLAFDKLHTGGGGPYLDVFNGYRFQPTQVRVKDADTHICFWHGDPHFQTFNGRHFDLLMGGDFTIYENKQDGFELQARTFPCNGWAACNCALAVRERSDVIRVNMCGSRGAVAPKVEVGRQPLRQGTVIQRSRGGHFLMIYFPSGRELKIDAGFRSLNGYLSVPGSDEGHGRGLCGTLDGHFSTDLTSRDGRVDNHTPSCNINPMCQPKDIVQSWRNPKSTSLFESVPNDLNNFKEDPKYCQCDTAIRGSPRVNCTSGGNVVHRIQHCSTHCPDVTSTVPQFLQGGGLSGVWTRRDTATAAAATAAAAPAAIYVDQDEPDPPQDLTAAWPTPPVVVTWPTPSGITQQQAELKCRQAITGSQLYSHCPDHHDSLAFTVNSCVADIMYGDNYDLVDAAVAAFTAQCQFQISQDPQNYVSNPDGSSVLSPQFLKVCSILCSRHGTCQQGRCQCHPGWTGDDCQLREGQPPVLERLRGSPFCDLNQRPCKTIYFDASHFETGDHFKCKVQRVLPDGRLRDTPFEDSATFISGDRLSCPLPDATNRSVTVFSVSVTYDGSSYSNSKRVTVYDSTCQDCNDNGCVQKSNTCLIHNMCHQNGDFNTADETQKCDTSASTVQWTTDISQHFPKFSIPVVSGPDDTFMMSCAVPTSARSPSARYRVTWYSDAMTVILQQTVDGDTPVAKISTFELPHGRLNLRCKVTSFFAGSNTFSPEQTSAIFPWRSA